VQPLQRLHLRVLAPESRQRSGDRSPRSAPPGGRAASLRVDSRNRSGGIEQATLRRVAATRREERDLAAQQRGPVLAPDQSGKRCLLGCDQDKGQSSQGAGLPLAWLRASARLEFGLLLSVSAVARYRNGRGRCRGNRHALRSSPALPLVRGATYYSGLGAASPPARRGDPDRCAIGSTSASAAGGVDLAAIAGVAAW